MTICMTPTRPRKSAEGPQSGSLTDWTTVKSGNAYEGEDERWNPPSPPKPRSRIIWKPSSPSPPCCPKIA